MQFFEYYSKERKLLENPYLLSLDKSVLVYLGCLSHVRDRHINAQFYNYVDRLKGDADIHVIAPVCGDAEEETLRTLRRNFNISAAGPGIHAAFIYDNLISPLLDRCEDFNDPLAFSDVKKYLSRICLFGYSYGTCLLQQVADVMACDILRRLADDPDRIQKTYEICRSIKAVGIGPTGRLRYIGDAGKPVPLRWDEDKFEVSPTIFSQMLFLMRHDMVTRGAYGDEPFGTKLQSDTGIEYRMTKSAMLVIDYTPPPIMKVVGYFKDGDGNASPRIWQTPDTLIHDHRTYTYMHERQGDFMLPQTLAMTPVLRAATRAMLNPALDGPAWLQVMQLCLISPEQREILAARRDASDDEISLVIDQVATAPEILQGEVVRDYLNGLYNTSIAEARDRLIALLDISTGFWETALNKMIGLPGNLKNEMLQVFAHGQGRSDRLAQTLEIIPNVMASIDETAKMAFPTGFEPVLHP